MHEPPLRAPRHMRRRLRASDAPQTVQWPYCASRGPARARCHHGGNPRRVERGARQRDGCGPVANNSALGAHGGGGREESLFIVTAAAPDQAPGRRAGRPRRPAWRARRAGRAHARRRRVDRAAADAPRTAVPVSRRRRGRDAPREVWWPWRARSRPSHPLGDRRLRRAPDPGAAAAGERPQRRRPSSGPGGGGRPPREPRRRPSARRRRGPRA